MLASGGSVIEIQQLPLDKLEQLFYYLDITACFCLLCGLKPRRLP